MYLIAIMQHIDLNLSWLAKLLQSSKAPKKDHIEAR